MSVRCSICESITSPVYCCHCYEELKKELKNKQAIIEQQLVIIKYHKRRREEMGDNYVSGFNIGDGT